MDKERGDIFLSDSEQWGYKSVTRGGTTTITFPITFTSLCFSVIGVDADSTGGQDNSRVNSTSLKSFVWYSGASSKVNFIATGK